ncbi:MAG: hypothetical protein ACHQHP_02635 [Bacteroidia bacterium]
MRAFKYITDLFLYSNIFISFCAAAITIETYLLRIAEINWMYVSFVFFSTLVFYDFPSLFFAGEAFSADESERHIWIKENKKFLGFFLALGSIGVAVTAFFFPMKFILSFIPTAIIAFAYFFPQTRLRSIAGLKAGVIAFVWTAVSCIYPMLLHSFPESDFNNFFYGYNGLLMAQRFFFMLPLCIIFNVRDMEADRSAGIRTIPLAYGISVTKVICLVSLFLFTAFLRFPFGKIEIVLIVSAIVSAIFILGASRSRSEYFYSFWIDGMILLQAGVVGVIYLL